MNLRIRRITYTNDIHQEEPGGIQDPIQRKTDNRVVHSFVFHDEDVPLLTEAFLEFGTNRYPTGNFDSEWPSPGDSEYSYYLERQDGDEWKFVKALNPYPVEMADEAIEDWE